MRPIARSLATLSAAMLLVACGGGGATTAPTAGGPAATTAAVASAEPICTDPGAGATAAVQATVGGNEWSSVTAKVDDVITWTNSDGVPHRVVLDDGRCSKMPNIKGGGGTQSLTFSEAGSFPFHCGVHSNMKGTIVIT